MSGEPTRCPLGTCLDQPMPGACHKVGLGFRKETGYHGGSWNYIVAHRVIHYQKVPLLELRGYWHHMSCSLTSLKGLSTGLI